MADYEEGGEDGLDDLGEDLFSGIAEEDAAAVVDAVELPGIKPELRKLYERHPELIIDYIETVLPLAENPQKNVTYPFLTIYERPALFGLRPNK